MKMNTDMRSSNLTKTIQFNIHCVDNGHNATTYVLAGDTYGKQLGTTPSSELAIFDAWNDPIYDEVVAMVHDLLDRTRGVSDCVLLALGAACDLAPSGYAYDFTGRIWCPVCGSSNIEYGPDDPPQLSVRSIPHVTHDAWLAATKDEQRQRIVHILESGKCSARP
ncbi:MAG: hypothetical protein KDH90_15655 [Anaerolineae bacterium]|nr:hypothetical protein [Anaerolineae bacterium]